MITIVHQDNWSPIHDFDECFHLTKVERWLSKSQLFKTSHNVTDSENCLCDFHPFHFQHEFNK
jgi:hypothetical protein